MPILDAEHLYAIAAGTPSALEEYQNLPRLNDLESAIGQFESRPEYFVRVEGNFLDKVSFASGDVVAVRHRTPQASAREDTPGARVVGDTIVELDAARRGRKRDLRGEQAGECRRVRPST